MAKGREGIVLSNSRKLYPYLDYVNLGSIQYYIERGVLDPSEKITIKTLVDKGVVDRVKWGLKVLAKVSLN